jgi:hypothetical protein
MSIPPHCVVKVMLELGSGFTGFFKNPGRILKSLPGGFPFFFAIFLTKKMFFSLKFSLQTKLFITFSRFFRNGQKVFRNAEPDFYL